MCRGRRCLFATPPVRSAPHVPICTERSGLIWSGPVPAFPSCSAVLPVQTRFDDSELRCRLPHFFCFSERSDRTDCGQLRLQKQMRTETVQKKPERLDRFRPLMYNTYIILADVAELADASDLKSDGTHLPYRFEPGYRHQRCMQPVLHAALFLFPGLNSVAERKRGRRESAGVCKKRSDAPGLQCSLLYPQSTRSLSPLDKPMEI